MIAGSAGRHFFLDERRVQMHIELHQRTLADAPEAVNLAGLDDEDVTGAGLELLAVHDPQTATLADELHFVVGMPMRPRTASRLTVEQKDRDADVAVVGANEIV